jgi:hypothetical protein
MARCNLSPLSAFRRPALAAAMLLASWTSVAPAAEGVASGAGATMTAVRFHDYGDATQLRLEQAPRPVPTSTQVRARGRAASVDPCDWKFREGRRRAFIPANLARKPPPMSFEEAAGIPVAALVGEGRLRMTVGTVLPLAEAAKAQELSKQGGTPGKIILRID